MKFILLSFLIFSSSVSFAKTCESVNAGMDIGSGSIKLLVAIVDECQKEIKTILVKDSKAVDFNTDFLKSESGLISEEILKKGELVLADFKKRALEHKAQKIHAVATSVFRKANNGKQAITSWKKKLKLKSMTIISQDEEAELGMLSVLSQQPKEQRARKSYLMWDIGGGSMQMLTYDQNNQKQIYYGELASIGFKNMVMESLQLKNIEKEKSPNPLLDKRESALMLAKSYAKIHVPQKIKELAKEKTIIGIGGVHNFSIHQKLATKNNFYTLAELKAFLLIQAQKKDEDLTGDYRETDVTNLALVGGFMEALTIDKVEVKSASLLEGLLVK